MKHLSTTLFVVLGALGSLQAAPVDLRAEYEAVKTDLKAHRDAAALATCERALASRPTDPELVWGFLIGAGLAADKLKRPLEALGYLERFLASYDARRASAGTDWAKRRKGVEKQVTRLEQALLAEQGRVTFESSPPGATATIDGQAPRGGETATTPLRVFLAPGRHKLRLVHEGFAPVDLDVTVAAGRRDTVHVPLYAVQKPAPAPLAPPVQTVAASPSQSAKPPVPDLAAAPAVKPAAPLGVTSRPSRLRPLWGWLAVGTGGAVLLAGIPFTVLAANDADKLGDLDPSLGQAAGSSRYHELESSMNTNQTVAWVLYGLGAAVAAGGATYLLFFAEAPDAGAPASTALQPGLVPLAGGAALTLGGRW